MSAPLSRSTAASFLASFAPFTASITSATCNKGSQCLSTLLLKPAASEFGKPLNYQLIFQTFST